VPVDVTVLDKDRRPVRGLTAGDFTLLVDGKPRPIAAFSEVDIPGPEANPTGAAWVRNAPHDVANNDLPGEGRLVVILMDGSIPNGAPVATAKKIAHAAIDQLGPADLAAVVRSTVFSGNGRSQGFTSDRALLGAAVDSQFMGTTVAPSMTMRGLESASPVPGSLSQTQMQCEVILNLARAMRDAPLRRKELLFIGSQLALGGTITTGGERRYCRDDMMKEVLASNVTVHVVDPAGVITASVQAEYLGPVTTGHVQRWSIQNQQRLDVLRVMPGLTGGRAVVNTNTPEAMLPALFQESQTYYLLGFDPLPFAADRSAHTIRVKVNRRGVTVRSRGSYDVPDARTRESSKPDKPDKRDKPGDPGALPPDLASAITAPLPLQGLPLSATAVPFAQPGARTAAVAIAIGTTLPPGPGPHRLAMSVVAFDDRGRGVAVRSQELEVSPPTAQLGRAADGLIARLDLPPGSYDIRVAATDDAGRVGSVFTFVDVPDFSRSGLVAPGMLLHHDRALAVTANPVADLVPVVPTVQRVFTPGDKVSAFLRVYHTAGAQPLSITERVTDVSGRTVFERPFDVPAGDRGEATDVDVPLPLSQLAPGRYLLTISIARGRVHIERQARFEIDGQHEQ
jgi:VWFA-related protein